MRPGVLSEHDPPSRRWQVTYKSVATLDTGLVANDYPDGIHTRSITKQSQFTP
ncbi:hypothetical protein OAH05_01335 [bacterium]|nr:hypothetical protein [bacterium]